MIAFFLCTLKQDSRGWWYPRIRKFSSLDPAWLRLHNPR